MNIEKTIKSNRIFIVVQLIALIVDVILSFICDISIYFMFAFFFGVAVVLYNAFVQSVFRNKVIFKSKNYISVIRKHPYSFTDLRIYILAKNTKDTKIKKVLDQGFISIGIMVANFLYILVITMILHPQNIV
jgi:hypothetical protein